MGCSLEMLGIVAMVSCDASVFMIPKQKREEAVLAHRQFAAVHGDHGTLLAVLQAWSNIPRKRQRRWAEENFLNSKALVKAREIYQQLQDHLRQVGVALTSCAGDDDAIRRALVAGLFPNAAKRQMDGEKNLLWEFHCGLSS